MKLKDKVAIITGAAQGIGLATALKFAREGAIVIVCDVHPAGVDDAVARCRELGALAEGHVVNVAHREQVDAMVARVRETHGRIDVLVNNAGITGPKRLLADSTLEDWTSVFMPNVIGVALHCREAVRRMSTRRGGQGGVIVNVSSLSAAPIDFTDVMIERGYTGNRAYGQSKLAQVMFTIDLAAELKPKGIVVQSLHPATYMNTTMVTSAGLTPRSTVEEGTAAVMNAITTDAPSGSYFVGQKVGTPHAQAADADARRQLRDVSRKLTGVS